MRLQLQPIMCASFIVGRRQGFRVQYKQAPALIHTYHHVNLLLHIRLQQTRVKLFNVTIYFRFPAFGYFNDDDILDIMVSWQTGSWPAYDSLMVSRSCFNCACLIKEKCKQTQLHFLFNDSRPFIACQLLNSPGLNLSQWTCFNWRYRLI